jgi:hypothetical protein
MVAKRQDSCTIDSIKSTKDAKMTTTDYLVSKGYSEEEIKTIMQEIAYYNESPYLYDAEPVIVREIGRVCAPEFDDIPF